MAEPPVPVCTEPGCPRKGQEMYARGAVKDEKGQMFVRYECAGCGQKAMRPAR